jgi:hypothetical protein
LARPLFTLVCKVTFDSRAKAVTVPVTLNAAANPIKNSSGIPVKGMLSDLNFSFHGFIPFYS